MPYHIIRAAMFAACLAVISAGGAGCANSMSGKSIEEALYEHTPELMAVPGVVGTAQGLCGGRPCIKVYVVKKTPELEKKIPGALEGYPVMVEETGEIKALPRR